MIRPPVRLADMLGALAFASDLAFGVELEDGARSCLIAVRIAEHMRLSRDQVASVYYTALLKDAGCTAWTGSLASFWKTDEIAARRELILGDLRSRPFLARWMWQHVGTELPFPQRIARMASVAAKSGPFVEEGFRSSCEVATLIAARLGMTAQVQQALRNVFEEWDGKGFPDGLAGEQIPLVSRVVLPSFYFASLYRIGGREAATTLIREGRDRLFDPAVVDVFLRLASEDSFWQELDAPGLPERVAELEPDAAGILDDASLDAWAEVFADFGDLKLPHMAAHSRRVAALATSMASRLGCGAGDVRDIRRAALSHDIGLVSVPTYALQKPAGDRSAVEKEQIRLHPYTAGRVLAHVEGLAPLVTLIQAHHEHHDGTGFHQGLKGDQIPFGARIIAVADAFDDLTHDGPDSPAREPGDALRLMSGQRGLAYAPEALDALQAELGGPAVAHPRAAWPGGLTDREVEVLRMATEGVTRGEIAKKLVVSEHTVRHHLSHIYEKTGVTTRVGATLWAMENGLFSRAQK
jgi:HD-GYP domain-containing protein (c-di-GMP phosphodiesterase class II)